MQDHAFAGEEGEDPNLHLLIFDSLCRTFKQKELSLDFVLLKLFRWSLKGKALAWLQSLPHRYITNWEKCVTFFLQKFTSYRKMMQARKDIIGFTQKIGESFAQACGRFKDLINFVPNHGFSEFVIYHTFYYGLNDDSKHILDGSA